MNIQKKLKELGYNSVPQTFYNQIRMWKEWYDGKVNDFHRYQVYNGISYLDCERYSIGMGKKVCEDWANLLLNEKVSITLEGEAEQEFVNSVLDENNFKLMGNELQERKAWSGTAAIVPYVDGMVVSENGTVQKSGKIKLNYCTALSIYPLTWENGTITECAFCSEWRANGKCYTYMQIHHLDGANYVIENRAFEGNKEIPIATLPGYENTPEIINTGSDKPQFVIDRMNIANPDEENPMGIAVFANSIDQLKSVDIAYDGYVNEFVLGKKRIVVKPEATKDINGRPIFDARETVYYALPEDGSNGNFLEQIDMSLRTAEFNAGMQDMLNVLSSKCGFGENHYKYDRGNVSTATQVVSENSTMFRTIKKHELLLEGMLINLCRIILRMGNAYMGMKLDEDVEISVDFDDSIIEDEESDFNRDARLLQMGILNDWEFRAKWMNEDEETAKAALPKMESLVVGE